MNPIPYCTLYFSISLFVFRTIHSQPYVLVHSPAVPLRSCFVLRAVRAISINQITLYGAS